jgi:hypothetical protein
MTTPSLAELTDQISFAVEAVDVRYRIGELGPADIDDLKRTIDEARLRLWGLLNTASGPEGRVFEERMRIRRAKEICARVSGDLVTGKMSRDHKELAELSATVAELVTVIGAKADGGKAKPSAAVKKPVKSAPGKKASGKTKAAPKRKR